MKFAVLGRSHWLYDTARLAVSRGHQPVLVGTCPSAPDYRIKETAFEQLARDAGCPFFSDARINDERYVRLARDSGAEIALSVNWLTMIGPAMIEAFPRGILNAHAGDLPRYRGNACPNWAILAGEDHIGACVHLMVPELDAGPVVLRRSFPLGPETYIGEVYEFLDGELPRMLVEGMEGLASGILEAQPQPSDPSFTLRCFPRTPEDGLIDWREAAEKVCRLVRASAEPFAGAFTYFDEQRLTVWRARPSRLPYQWMGVPGQVAEISAAGEVIVLCGEGVAVLSEVQLAGSGRGKASAVVRSTRSRLGSRSMQHD